MSTTSVISTLASSSWGRRATAHEAGWRRPCTRQASPPPPAPQSTLATSLLPWPSHPRSCNRRSRGCSGTATLGLERGQGPWVGRGGTGAGGKGRRGGGALVVATGRPASPDSSLFVCCEVGWLLLPVVCLSILTCAWFAAAALAAPAAAALLLRCCCTAAAAAAPSRKTAWIIIDDKAKRTFLQVRWMPLPCSGRGPWVPCQPPNPASSRLAQPPDPWVLSAEQHPTTAARPVRHPPPVCPLPRRHPPPRCRAATHPPQADKRALIAGLSLGIPIRDMRLLDFNLLTSETGKLFVRDNAILFSIEHVRLIITVDKVLIPREGGAAPALWPWPWRSAPSCLCGGCLPPGASGWGPGPGALHPLLSPWAACLHDMPALWDLPASQPACQRAVGGEGRPPGAAMPAAATRACALLLPHPHPKTPKPHKE